MLDILDALIQARQRRFTPGTVEQENRLERLTRYDQRAEIDAALDINDLPPRCNRRVSPAMISVAFRTFRSS